MTDIDKALAEAMKDAVLYGTGFIKDGKHISIEDVYLDPRDATIEAQAAEIEMLRDALGIAIVLVAAELPYAPMLPHLRAALAGKAGQ
jgi:hypothetical protein